MNKILLSEDALIQELDNESVVVVPGQGMISTINEVGTFILKYLKENENVTIEILTQKVRENFDAPEDQIKKDLENFIFEMKSNDIIR